ncbi:MAG: alpha/beta fold hydrolase [Saprospiraceae bacterium]|nr:alpha/beta fold hydrolase [Saprospiraceae bacterium]
MKDGYVDVQGVKIYYQERGQGEPLILLMGFGADGNTWEKHVAVYAEYFHCILIDNRGVGKSGAPEGPYSTFQMAKDSIAVMDHLQISKARIAGISMGGAIAQELAINFPDRVHSLILISTWPVFNNYAKTVYRNLKKLRVTSHPEDFMELLQLWIFAPPYYRDHLHELQTGQTDAKDNKAPQSKAGFDGQLDACIEHDTVDRLQGISAPTLITIGLMDIFTPPAFSAILHKGIKNSEMIEFPEGGHVHHWEDLERFNQVTLDFLLKIR